MDDALTTRDKQSSRDEQSSRYEVFLQSKIDQPHQNVGSVWAADEEMALLNARDVFVRRPECLSLWVVPAAQILMRTGAEVNELGSRTNQKLDPPDVKQTYYVFNKSSQRRSMTYVTFKGEIEARTPEEALEKAAVESNSEDNTAYVWWVCPASTIVRSEPDDADSWFGPASDKAYKQPTAYKTYTAIRRAKKSEGK